ncbi:MAG: ParB/RepB/Spo0J family partition protein [Oscillospiraceae bacterium]|nr:ParB/RepB/Spo0J family partition protein [Oscillospiraceae bacterium]
MAKKGGLGKGLSAIFMENESEDQNSTVTLKISEIEPNKDQPRTDFDDKALSELAESIALHGVLQPLLVRPLVYGGYQIVAGERRYRASRMAGLTEVPVVIRELDDKETMELALIENLQRENLTPIEEAKGYKTLMDTYGFTQEQVSSSVGKSRSAVANSLRLLNLPEEIIDLISQGKITGGHARALLSLENKEEMLKISREIMDKDLSVRQTEKLTQKSKKGEKNPPKKEEKTNFLKEVELALTENLCRKISVTKKGDGGVLSIEFFSQEDLIDLANKLEEKE